MFVYANIATRKRERESEQERTKQKHVLARKKPTELPTVKKPNSLDNHNSKQHNNQALEIMLKKWEIKIHQQHSNHIK